MRPLLNFVVILAGLLALGWWFVFGDTMAPRTLHCRRTVVVDTPEGKHSGSSVVEVAIRFPGGLARAQGYAVMTRIRGEATVVDLGARGLLIVTLADERRLLNGVSHDTNPGCESPFPRAMFRSEEASSKDEYADYLDELNKRRPEGDVPLKYLPMFIRFRDIRDPASLEQVDPLNLAASFGNGVKFERMSIKITDARVTNELTSILPWLASHENQRISTRSLPPVSHSAIDLLNSNDLRSVPQ